MLLNLFMKQQTMEKSKGRLNNMSRRAAEKRKFNENKQRTKAEGKKARKGNTNTAFNDAAKTRLIDLATKEVEKLNAEKIITLAEAYNIDQEMDRLRQQRTRLLTAHKNQVAQRKIAAKKVPELGKYDWSFFLRQGAGNSMLMKVAASVRARAKQPSSSNNNRIPGKLLNNLRTHIGNETLPEMSEKNAADLSKSLNIFKFMRSSAVDGKPLSNRYQQEPWYKGENGRKGPKSRGNPSNNNKGNNKRNNTNNVNNNQ